jgi:hypothetical protein
MIFNRAPDAPLRLAIRSAKAHRFDDGSDHERSRPNQNRIEAAGIKRKAFNAKGDFGASGNKILLSESGGVPRTREANFNRAATDHARTHR